MNKPWLILICPLALFGAEHSASSPNRVDRWNGRDLAGWGLFLSDPATAAASTWSADEGVRRGTKASGPGSVIFFAANAVTRLRNPGTTPATYVVISYYTPLTPKPQAAP